ncbi:hypothetical protein IFM89_034564 [Coptis chinensis]|uniref:Pentatricopeptide repeat-containing protein n=1 Tax=Coptis chinensis TaxID=261450 RepID=A0A835HQW4_9MAGN|nr:hypothetical protein IFM89_034564 [Coptis chinensis]
MGQPLTKSVYDGIHRSLTAVGRFDEAEKVLDTMRNAGYEPDNTLTATVFGFCKAGRMEDREAQGYILDFRTWTLLIQRHCLAGEIDQALNFFTEMLEKNFDADPNLLEALVNGMCSKERVDGAYSLVIEMVEKFGTVDVADEFLAALTIKEDPSTATYSHAVKSFCKEGRQSKARDLPERCPHHIRKDGGIAIFFSSPKLGTQLEKKMRKKNGGEVAQ